MDLKQDSLSLSLIVLTTDYPDTGNYFSKYCNINKDLEFY